MTTFKAKVLDNIPANRLVGLGGINRDDNPEEGWDSVYLVMPKLGQIPDLVATGALEEGQEVNVTIKNNPVWNVEASERLPAGTLVQCTDDGRVQNFKTSAGTYFGFTTESAEEGDVVSVVRKYGQMPQEQVEQSTYEAPKTSGLEDMTNDELKELLEKEGIEYNNKATKKELIQLLGGD